MTEINLKDMVGKYVKCLWPEEKTYDFWMNIYGEYGAAGGYESKEDADENASKDRIACLHFTGMFKKGEGI